MGEIPKSLVKSNPQFKSLKCGIKIIQGVDYDTGKYFSDALILASVNPQYGKRLFIDSPEKYKFRTCCVQILF